MRDSGIAFTVWLEDMPCNLDNDNDIFEYMTDPNAFGAKKHGASMECWNAWRRAHNIDTPRCPALTRKKRPCNGFVHQAYNFKDFKMGFTEYCIIHQKFL